MPLIPQHLMKLNKQKHEIQIADSKRIYKIKSGGYVLSRKDS